MIYLMQASPITRMALPEWQLKCIENPELLKSNEPFTVHIPRPCGGISLVHRKLTPPTDLIKRGDRLIEEDEVSPLVNWLTDEHSFETDIYGVVSIRVGDSVADALMAVILGGETDQLAKIVAESKEQMKKDFAKAQAQADERVMRACGKMFRVVKETVAEMKKNNKGIYSPSYAEALMMEVMKDTIAQKRRPDMKAQQMMDRAMEQLEQPL